MNDEGLELDILTQALKANLLILEKVMNTPVKRRRQVLIAIVIELSNLCNNVLEPLRKDSGI